MSQFSYALRAAVLSALGALLGIGALWLCGYRTLYTLAIPLLSGAFVFSWRYWLEPWIENRCAGSVYETVYDDFFNTEDESEDSPA